jgi:hypothetical protein
MSSNVIQTSDQTGKLKWQNLDSAFGGKYEDLLTLGKGEVSLGVPPSLPVIHVETKELSTSLAVSGPCSAVFYSLNNVEQCSLDISGLVFPVGTLVVFCWNGEGEHPSPLALNGKGLVDDLVGNSQYIYVVKPNGDLAPLAAY